MSKVLYVALFGDVAGSRRLPAHRRSALQESLRAAVGDANRRWRKAIAARFAITLGDQFQGLLATAEPLWEISHWFRSTIPEVEWVMAAGRGAIATPLAPVALEVDGPCFHRARDALAEAKARSLVFNLAGFASGAEAFAAYYSALYWSWTARQRRAATLLRLVPAAEVADRLEVSRSAVSHLTARLRWDLVEAGDREFQQRIVAP